VQGLLYQKKGVKTMIKRIGSQCRESLKDSGMKLYERISADEVILIDDTGKKELWFMNDSSASYVIEIDGEGYEFSRDYNTRFDK
jgi:hypothetical protein